MEDWKNNLQTTNILIIFFVRRQCLIDILVAFIFAVSVIQFLFISFPPVFIFGTLSLLFKEKEKKNYFGKRI